MPKRGHVSGGGVAVADAQAPYDPQTPVQTPLRIQEIRLDELDEAVQFARDHEGAIDTNRLRLRTSLLARDAEGRIRGAAFCLIGQQTGVELKLVLAAAAAEEEATQTQETELTQRLIDKVLSKMRCEHVHRCSIQVHQAKAADRLWRTARWSRDRVCEPRTPISSALPAPTGAAIAGQDE